MARSTPSTSAPISAKSKTAAKQSAAAMKLGRNPFDKSKQNEDTPLKRKKAKSSALIDETDDFLGDADDGSSDDRFSLSKASEWLFVKLPADTLVLAVKTASLMKGSLTKKQEK